MDHPANVRSPGEADVPMKHLLFENAHVELHALPLRRVLVLTRRPTEATSASLLDTLRKVTQVVRPEHRGFGLVFDVRAVIGKSDPEFERGSGEIRALANASFARVVTLVRTQAGKLQTQRLAREEHRTALVSFDLEEAIALASRSQYAAAVTRLRNAGATVPGPFRPR